MADIKQHDNTPEFVPRRNQRLIDFFRKNGFNSSQIRLIGDENNPAVLYNNEYVLSCHVHNFDLKFTDAVFEGSVVKQYRLTAEVPSVRNELLRLIQDFPARRMYKVLHLSSGSRPLYLCGWNYMDAAAKEGRYPVFGEGKPKVFFTEQKAQELSDELNLEGYVTSVS